MRRATRGHLSHKFLRDHNRINVRKYFFANRVIDPWNSLPVSCVCSDTVIAFKNKVKQYNLDNFLFYTDAFTIQWKLMFNVYIVNLFLLYDFLCLHTCIAIKSHIVFQYNIMELVQCP